MAEQVPQDSQGQEPVHPIHGGDFDFKHLVDDSAPQPEMSVEAAAVPAAGEPSTTSGDSVVEYAYSDDQLAGMPEDVRQGIESDQQRQAEAIPAHDSAPNMPNVALETPTTGDRVTISKKKWTTAMHRKAAEAGGKLVIDPTSGLPINKPTIVHPGQLGKGSEG